MGRVFGADREGGVGERGGDTEQEQMLHVSRHEEAVLRDGCEPNCLGAG